MVKGPDPPFKGLVGQSYQNAVWYNSSPQRPRMLPPWQHRQMYPGETHISCHDDESAQLKTFH